jgi:hypothetical protein
LQIKTKSVSCHYADSKPVKQEVNGTVIRRPPLVFPALILRSRVSSFTTAPLANMDSFCTGSHRETGQGPLRRLRQAAQRGASPRPLRPQGRLQILHRPGTNVMKLFYGRKLRLFIIS